MRNFKKLLVLGDGELRSGQFIGSLSFPCPASSMVNLSEHREYIVHI